MLHAYIRVTGASSDLSILSSILSHCGGNIEHCSYSCVAS